MLTREEAFLKTQQLQMSDVGLVHPGKQRADKVQLRENAKNMRRPVYICGYSVCVCDMS